MIGTTISHYKLLDAFGSGAVGVVYRAEDIRLGLPRGIKPANVFLTTRGEAKVLEFVPFAPWLRCSRAQHAWRYD